MSPWAVKRFKEYGGDIPSSGWSKLYPSGLDQVAVAKTEPGDENNQDISSLVGKVDIRKLERIRRTTRTRTATPAALCRANQGLMEFVEMFKAPIKVLHPLLTATQEGNYNGTEGSARIPFNGIILAHSNEAEWQEFRQQEQRGVPRPRLHRQGAVLPARGEEVRIYESSSQGRRCARAVRAGDAGECWRNSRCCRGSRNRRTPVCSRRCASTTARS